MSSISLGVLPASLLEYECLLSLRCFLDSGEYASPGDVGAADAGVVLGADEEDLFELDLCAHLQVEEFAHDAIILRDLVLEALDAEDGEDLLGVGRYGDPLIGVVHVEHLLLLLLRLNGVLKTLLSLDLLAEERNLPLVHQPLVLLVHVIFMVHRLYTLLVQLAEVLREIGCSSRQQGPLKMLPEERQRGLQEFSRILELYEFKHI